MAIVEQKDIVLPEDMELRAFVFSEASNLVITEMFTDVVYDNEIHVKQISALTRMGRDIETAFQQRMAAEKRERGLIDDIPTSSIVKRPPNWLTIMAIFLGVIVIVAYGEYSGNIGAWTASLSANFGYIVVAVILALAVILLARIRRRRPSS